MRSEANLANAILKNTREKNCKLDRFVSAFVEAFETCSDTVKKYKTCSIQEIRLEKEFATLRSDKDSEVFNAWKELVGETQLPQSESSAVVYQHVLQHFWSCVALKKESGETGNESNILVGLKISGDASEREAIRQHAGWAIKRARDVINTGNKTVSIKQCQGLPTSIEVTKERLLSFFEKFGQDERQNEGKYLFIVNDAVLEFFIILHEEVNEFFKACIDKDTVLQCLKHLSVNRRIRTQWENVVGISSGEEEKAASIIVLQRVLSMFLKSKQQIIREQLHLKPQKKSKSLRQTLYHNKKE